MFASRVIAFAAFFAATVSALPAPESNLIERTLADASEDEMLNMLEKRAAIVTKCTGSGKTVALTFDDGPYTNNKKLVDYLNSQGVKATFFFNGNNYGCIYNYKSQIQHAYDTGHQIASHTWAHKHLTSQSASSLRSEIDKVNDALSQLIGVKPRYIRPPYGEYNSAVLTAIEKSGQVAVNWDFDSGDSVGASVQTSKNSYNSQAAKNKPFIALNHETIPNTVNQLIPYVVPMLKSKGYKFVTVATCTGKGGAYLTKTAVKTKWC